MLGAAQVLFLIVGIVILLQRWLGPPHPETSEASVSIPIPAGAELKEPEKKVTDKTDKKEPPAKKTPPPTPSPRLAPAKDPLEVARLHAEAILPAHLQQPLGLTYSPDGRLLVSTSRDGALRLWDMTGASRSCSMNATSKPGARIADFQPGRPDSRRSVARKARNLRLPRRDPRSSAGPARMHHLAGQPFPGAGVSVFSRTDSSLPWVSKRCWVQQERIPWDP